MSETEEWTVVSSKPRVKKTVPPPQEESSSCKPNSNNNNNNNKRYDTNKRGQPTWRGANKNAPLPAASAANRVKKQENASGNASSCQSGTVKNTQGQRQHQSDKIEEKKEARNQGKNQPIVSFQTLTKPGSSNSSANVLLKTNTQTDGESSFRTKCPIPIATEQQRIQKGIQAEVLKTSNNEGAASTSAAASVETAPKKKKQKSKTERRKTREEKFYQALYQNKDSHIQFVTADMIRKLQNDQKVPAAKSSSTSNKFTSATLQMPTLIQSFNAMSIQGNSMEDFPSLTPSKSNERQDIRPSTSRASTNNQNDGASSIDIPVSETKISGTEKDKQFPVTPKILDTPISTETPTSAKRNSTSNACSSAKGKKSKQPMIIDVSSLIISKKKEKDCQRKFATPNTPFGRPGGLKRENFKITAGNPLDSSGPGVINRGKIRQKKKKPTKLKLTILRSRALKRILFDEKDKQIGDQLETEESINLNETNEATAIKTEFDDSSFNLTINSEGFPAENDELVEPKEETKCIDDIIPTTDQDDIMNEFVELKNEEMLNKENVVISDNNDSSLKFIKLLDEMSMLKVVDEKFSPEIEVAVKSAMHNRKFRDYCDMYTSKELHHLVLNLLSELFRFQDRLYHTDPIKFKTKRRFVSGLKEALSYLNLGKIQLLIIAPDIERNPEPGGLDEKITQILNVANGKRVPYVFSGSKYNLGKPMRIKTPISIISVLDKQNCEETFRTLLEEATRLKEKYHNDFAIKAKELQALENKT